MNENPKSDQTPLPGNGARVPMSFGSPPISTNNQLDTVKPHQRANQSAQKTGRSIPNFAAPKTVDLELLKSAILDRSGDTREDSESTLSPASIGDHLTRHRNPLSSFLISVIFHLAVVLALTFFFFSTVRQPSKLSDALIAEITPVEDLSQSPLPNNTVEIEIPDINDSAADLNTTTASSNNVSDSAAADLNPNIITDIVDPNLARQSPNTLLNATLPTGGGLEGRNQSERGRLAGLHGGTPGSEQAVENGLRWIIRHQRDDGSWSFQHDDGRCHGQCKNLGVHRSKTAATGLALMALLGAGYTQKSGPYQTEIRNGLDYLISQIRLSKHGGSLSQGQTMYSHAIATIALSEAHILTGESGLTEPIIAARKYIESAQHTKGGWRYEPQSPGDMTVTGWQLMALKSCELGGFESGEITWTLAESFIDSLGSSSGAFGYQNPDEKPSTTAIGVLCKMYLGAALEHHQLELGSQLLTDHGPSETDMYYNYYATQVLHHRNAPGWSNWNTQLRDYLVQSQDKSDRHSAGSWYFIDKKSGTAGGRLYTTAMAVMILEVYYRYLPLYDRKAIR